MANFTKEVDNKLTEIRPLVMKELRYTDNASLAVKVFSCRDNEITTFDVEVQVRENGDYKTCWVSDTFYSETDESIAEKEAIKRAKIVLKSVKNWLPALSIADDVEVYT